MKIFNQELFKYRPHAVFFDMDNTLYSYEPVHKIAMEAVKGKVLTTFSISSKQFDVAFLQARNTVKQRLSHTACSHSRLLYFQLMLELLGLRSQVLFSLDLEQTYWRTYLGNIVLFDGVINFLDELRISGVPVALITDLTAQIQFRKLIYLGLDQYFDYVVTSEEAGSDKLKAAPFEIAVQKIQPRGPIYWMIGDDPISDIATSRHCINAVTIQKVHDGVNVLTGDARPDCVIENFAELSKIFVGCEMSE